MTKDKQDQLLNEIHDKMSRAIADGVVDFREMVSNPMFVLHVADEMGRTKKLTSAVAANQDAFDKFAREYTSMTSGFKYPDGTDVNAIDLMFRIIGMGIARVMRSKGDEEFTKTLNMGLFSGMYIMIEAAHTTRVALNYEADIREVAKREGVV